MKSLYDRIGGDSAVKMTVLKLYGKILNDDDLAPFFDNIDVDRLRNSQAAFVTYAFGGKTAYEGRSLRSAHGNSVKNGLNDKHFDLVAKYLNESMEELGVAEDLIEEAMNIVGSTRNDVLNK